MGNSFISGKIAKISIKIKCLKRNWSLNIGNLRFYRSQCHTQTLQFISHLFGSISISELRRLTPHRCIGRHWRLRMILVLHFESRSAEVTDSRIGFDIF